MTHDSLCYLYRESGEFDLMADRCVNCRLIARVRASERARVVAEAASLVMTLEPRLSQGFDESDTADLLDRYSVVAALTGRGDWDPNGPSYVERPNGCPCARCNAEAGVTVWWMVVCQECGDKRCPHASDHRQACRDANKERTSASSLNAAGGMP